MLRYMRRRAVATVPLLVLVPVVLFVLTQAAPGDAVDSIIGEYPVPDDYRRELESIYGLDQPWLVQMWNYVTDALTFQFGFSYSLHADVSELILRRLGPTLLLVVTGLAISSILGIVLGIVAAMSKSSRVDALVSGTAMVTLAVPSFWIAQILVILFAIRLGWFPATGMSSTRLATGVSPLVDTLHHLVLPVLALVIIEFGSMTRVMRSSTLETLGADYLTTAEMKGLSPRAIRWRHVIRNASLPAITVVGARFGRAIAGSLLIETVFAWPGMGSLLYDAILRRENQVILAIVMVVAISVVVVNLVTDLVYAIVDPRIRNA